MTQIDFYVLKKNGAAAQLNFTCRLVEKAYKNGHKILIHTTDEKQAGTIDDLLWTWRETSFIPHEIATLSSTDDCPVTINYQPEPPSDQGDVLVNLTNEVPSFFSRFNRVTEIVDSSEQCRQSARNRYRFYQKQGYCPQSHDIKAA